VTRWSSRVDAATVAFFTAPPFDPSAGAVDQGNLLSRTAESADRLGTTLAFGRHTDDNDAASDRVFIGVHGEDNAAGIVQSTPTSREGNSIDITVAGVPNPSVS
jgi:hypothetical protein